MKKDIPFDPTITYLMNPHTGSVDTEENWKSEFREMSSEEWGGKTYEDARLFEVVKDEDGDWIMKEDK
jgi:hypothetical protein